MLDLFGDDASATFERGGLVEVRQRDPFARITTRIPNAVLLDGDGLSAIVAERYAAIDQVLAKIHRHPIRFWNYVPGIIEPLETGLDRYMAFNRGRHAAYVWSSGIAERFERTVPTASAVGVQGQDLVIDCLASESGGTPIENPRQIASWRYSRRYGPKPPCFARGTLTTLGDRQVLLVAGTASIVGDESRHHGDAQAQVTEILRNIEALIRYAGCSGREPLHQLTDLRIYVVRPDDIDTVDAELRAACTSSLRIESAVARVCRPELLVEIEGVALMS